MRRRQRLSDAFFVDRARQVALVEHLAQHDVAAFQRRQRVLGGVVCGWRLDDPGQQRRLPRLELFDAELVGGHAAAEVVDVVPEVGLGGRLDPVGAVAEVDRVEVGRDDLFLGPLVGELVGQRGLPELLEDRAVRLGLKRVLDELLLDRGGALHGASVQDVLDERAGDAADVDPAVGLEALVLDRDHRLLDDLRDLFGRDDHAVLLAEHADGVADVVSRSELWASLSCEKRVSEGRSEAIETNIPNTNETRPSSSTAQEDRREPQPLQSRLGRRRRCGGMSGRTSTLIGGERSGGPGAPERSIPAARAAAVRQRGALAPARV